MKYYSFLYGNKELNYIKRKNIDFVSNKHVLDGDIRDIIIDINKLTFVVETVESCSGHIYCNSSLPRNMQKAISKYLDAARIVVENYISEGDIEQEYLEFLIYFIKYEYAIAYYLISPFYKSGYKNLQDMIDNTEWGREIKEEILDLDEFGLEEYLEMSLYHQMDFIKLGEFISELPLDKNFKIVKEISEGAKGNKCKICPFCTYYNSEEKHGFLSINYINGKQSHDFDKALWNIFKGRKSRRVDTMQRDLEQMKYELRTADFEEGCVECGEPVNSNWICEEGHNVKKSLKTRIKASEGFIKKQMSISYYSKEIKTKKGFENLWNRVRKLIQKY